MGQRIPRARRASAIGDARAVGQIEIEHDHFDAPLGEALVGLCERGDDFDFVTVLVERALEQRTQIRIVVDDQNV